MGGEGANWIGQAPFTAEKHVFQNLGDGTYAHSELTAIRAAAAARVNITYKVLFNDAVAMTGGQPVEGNLSVVQIAHQVAWEGARRVVIVAEEPEKSARWTPCRAEQMCAIGKEKQGIVRIQTGSPDHACPQGYCEIARWQLNARGELVLRDEGGALLREHRLEPGQDPAAMALKLLRAWWSADRGSDFGRRLQYPSDDWMA